MKTKIQTLILSLAAILTFASCGNSDEDFPAPQESFFIGNWRQEDPKPENIVEGWTSYSFESNGKLNVKIHDFYRINEVIEYEGNWKLENKKLTIEYDTPDGTKRIRLVDIKFNEQKYYFSAREADSRQEYRIFKELLYTNPEEK